MQGARLPLDRQHRPGPLEGVGGGPGRGQNWFHRRSNHPFDHLLRQRVIDVRPSERGDVLLMPHDHTPPPVNTVTNVSFGAPGVPPDAVNLNVTFPPFMSPALAAY